MVERDAATNEIIELDTECYYIEALSVFIQKESDMKAYLKGLGWSDEEIEEARTDDEDDDNSTIYWTVYGG